MLHARIQAIKQLAETVFQAVRHLEIWSVTTHSSSKSRPIGSPRNE